MLQYRKFSWKQAEGFSLQGGFNMKQQRSWIRSCSQSATVLGDKEKEIKWMKAEHQRTAVTVVDCL